MLLNQSTLAGIADGRITAVYRRWQRPRVRAGSSVKTAIGVVAIDRVDAVSLASVTERAARSAGYASKAALAAELAKYGDGQLHRIAVRLAGPDPRIALRAQARLSRAELVQLEARLARLGATTPGGAWALPILRLIAARPAVRAPDLAAQLGMETLRFKPRVRQLKELGLTESLDIGYRLSARGRAVLRHLGG